MKLYVGNLAFSVTSDALKNAFSKFGEISEATIIEDKFSRRSKGFGFVTFSDDASGKKAIEEMNETEFEGRTLKVSEAKPMEESDRPRRPQSGGRFGGNGGSGGSRFGGNRFGSDRGNSNRPRSSPGRSSGNRRY